MFRTLIYPSSGTCDYSVELPHWSYCSWFDVCWSFGVVGLEWYPCCRLKPATKNNTTNVVIQQNSRKFLMRDILMSETCWAHKKKFSDINLVFYPSTTGWELSTIETPTVPQYHKISLIICSSSMSFLHLKQQRNLELPVLELHNHGSAALHWILCKLKIVSPRWFLRNTFSIFVMSHYWSLRILEMQIR